MIRICSFPSFDKAPRTFTQARIPCRNFGIGVKIKPDANRTDTDSCKEPSIVVLFGSYDLDLGSGASDASSRRGCGAGRNLAPFLSLQSTHRRSLPFLRSYHRDGLACALALARSLGQQHSQPPGASPVRRSRSVYPSFQADFRAPAGVAMECLWAPPALARRRHAGCGLLAGKRFQDAWMRIRHRTLSSWRRIF
jgi:hypothetical protein